MQYPSGFLTFYAPDHLSPGELFNVHVAAVIKTGGSTRHAALSFAEVTFAGETRVTDGEGNVRFKAPLAPGAYALTYSDGTHGTSAAELTVQPPAAIQGARASAIGIMLLPANQRVREPKTQYGVQIKLMDAESGYPLAFKSIEVTVGGHTELVATNARGVADTFSETPALYDAETVIEAVFKGDRAYGRSYQNLSFTTRSPPDGAARTGEVILDEGPNTVPGGTAGGVSVAESAGAPAAAPETNGRGKGVAVAVLAGLGAILLLRRRRG